MTTQLYEATFPNGVFRPKHLVSEAIAEGRHVRLVVEIEEKGDVLDLATGVYEGLSDEEIDEIEKVARDRPAPVAPRQWLSP